MRLFVLVLSLVLYTFGAGFLWFGLAGFEPSSDSDESVPLIVAVVFGGAGLVIMGVAVGLTIQTLEYTLPRWLAAIVVLSGLLPYPVLFGMYAIVLNLLLLSMAMLLLWTRRFGDPARLHGRRDTSPVE